MTSQKTWEHHVTEPNDNLNRTLMDPEEKFHLDNNKNPPVVVIFGWAGAVDKYLRAYAKLYNEKGVPTIRYIVPVENMFFHSDKMLAIGEEMADVFLEQKFDGSSVIIHALSNGGCYQYEVFARGLSKRSHPFEIKGMIFDSSPTKRNPGALYRAIKPNVDSKYFKVPISVYLTGYAMLKRTLGIYFARMYKQDCIQMNPYANLIKENSRWPQHFIYSTLDKVVTSENVERFADRRKALGVDVSIKRYENSHHVQHYMKNKSSYTRSVVKFINKCLRR